MKLATFLGIGRYEPVTYCLGTRKAEPTHLFPLAAAELFSPDEVVVFLTPQVRKGEHFLTLQDRIGTKLRPVDISV
ncbi:MAG: hypothetical protein ACP5VE_14315 [Chthonomonadales bacterium]